MDFNRLMVKPTKYSSLIVGVLLLFLHIGCTSLAQENTLPRDPDLVQGQLDNGFRYYIKKVDDETMQGEVSMGLYGRMGTWLEKEEQRGLAHLIEHMVIKNGALYDEGGDWWYTKQYHKHSEASTGLSHVEYQLKLRVPAYINEFLKALRSYARDTVIQQSLTDTSLVREYGRASVLVEAKKVNWENNIPRERLYGKIFGQPYYRNVEKELENIKSFDVADLEDYYTSWYRPDMQALYVVGDIQDVASVEANIRKLYSDLNVPDDVKSPSFSRWLEKRKATLPGALRVVAVKDAYNPVSRAGVYLAGPKPFSGDITPNTEQQARNQWVRDLYMEILQKRLRELTTGADLDGVHYNYPELTGMGKAYFFNIGFSLSQKDNKNVLLLAEQIYTELERMARYGVSPLELQVTRRMLLKRANSNQRSMYVRRIRENFLHGTPIMAPDARILLDSTLVKQVDTADIQAYARQLLNLPDQVLGVQVSEEAPVDHIPGDAEFRAMVAAIKEDTTIHPLPGKEVPESLLSSKQQEALSLDVAYTPCQTDQQGVQCLILDNGIRILLHPSPGSGRVILKGASNLKPTDYAQARDQLMAYSASTVVRRSGADPWSKEALQNYSRIHDMQCAFPKPPALNAARLITGDAPAGKEEELLQLLYLYLSSPGVDTTALSNWKHQFRSTIERGKSTDVFAQTITERFGEPHWEMVEAPSDAQVLEQIRPAHILRGFQEVYSPDKLTMTITGDFTIEKLKPILLRYLGHLQKVSVEPEMLNSAGGKKTLRPQIYPTSIDTTMYGQKGKGKLQFRWQQTDVSFRERVAWEVLREILWIKLSKATNKNYSFPIVTIEPKPDKGLDFLIEYTAVTDHVKSELVDMEHHYLEAVAALPKLVTDKGRVRTAKERLKERYGSLAPSVSDMNSANYLLEVAMGENGQYRQAREKAAILDGITREDLQNIVKSLEKVPRHVIRYLPNK